MKTCKLWIHTTTPTSVNALIATWFVLKRECRPVSPAFTWLANWRPTWQRQHCWSRHWGNWWIGSRLVLRGEQIKRTVFWGFATDSTYVIIVRATIGQHGAFEFDRTPVLELFSLDRTSAGVGAQILSELVCRPATDLGYLVPGSPHLNECSDRVSCQADAFKANGGVPGNIEHGQVDALKIALNQDDQHLVDQEHRNLKDGWKRNLTFLCVLRNCACLDSRKKRKFRWSFCFPFRAAICCSAIRKFSTNQECWLFRRRLSSQTPRTRLNGFMGIFPSTTL